MVFFSILGRFGRVGALRPSREAVVASMASTRCHAAAVPFATRENETTPPRPSTRDAPRRRRTKLKAV